MKVKYIIFLVIFFIIASIIVVNFKVPQRINYTLNGMDSYENNDFDITYSDIKEDCIFEINAQDIVDVNKKKILKLNNGLEVYIDRIEFDGKSYNFTIISVGHCSFNHAEIIQLPDEPDIIINTGAGSFVFQKVGNDPITNNKRLYYYRLSSSKNHSLNKWTNINLKIKITGLKIKKYRRK